MSPPGWVNHPETGEAYPRFSWELYQSAADLALIDKVRANRNEGAPLSDQDREQLLAAFGSPTGKALAYPTSLTSEERDAVVGWPEKETRQANLEAVGLGHMTAEEVIAKAHTGAEWMTLGQANLLRRRFNAGPLDAYEWSISDSGFHKLFAVKAVETDEEGMAYIKARVRWRALSELSIREDNQRKSQKAAAERAATQKDFEERQAKGQLTERELMIEKATEEARAKKEARKLAEERRLAECQAKYGTGIIGFGLYRTQELMDLLDEYWEQAADWRDGFFRGEKPRLFRRALKKTLEGEANEFDIMHQAVTGEKDWPLRYRIATKQARKLVAPAAAASLFRRDHRTNRPDGYEGRVKVRFTYNVHMHFWPLTRQEGFDMKKLWMEQEDHSKPYPFPGHDVTYENVREKVPWTHEGVPADVWAQFQDAVAKDKVRTAEESEPIPEGGVVLELPPNFMFPHTPYAL